MANSVRKVVTESGLTIDEIALNIPHQANDRIIELARRRLRVPPEKIVVNIDRYGNTSAASIPLALVDAIEEGRISSGDRLVFVGFGAGLTWAAAAFHWEPQEPTAIPVAGTVETAPTAEPTSSESNVEIFAVEGVGELEIETVRLLNRGGEVSMAGWKLDDGKGRVFTFPVFTFYSTGAVDVHTRAGQDSTIDLYWGLTEAVWLPGKLITLRDPSGTVQSTFKIPES